MKKLLSNVIIFTIGAIVGSAVTYKLVEKKCKDEALEEIEAVRNYYDSNSSSSEESEDEEDDSDKAAYKSIINQSSYASQNKEEDEVDKPYVISPEEFGECDYATISLTYFADGVVANERNKMIRNVDELIGEESLEHFGEYEDDSVFVRNDRLKIDYEILKDYRKFSEIS